MFFLKPLLMHRPFFSRLGFLFLCYQGCLFSKCKEFLLQNLSQFCRFSLWTIRLNLDAPRRLQGMRFLNRSLFLLQFFNFFFIFFFFNLSPVGCSKGSGDKILDKQPAPCVAFSRRTLFINPPATDSDTPPRNSWQIENYLKYPIFHLWSNVQNRSNSCDGSK